MNRILASQSLSVSQLPSCSHKQELMKIVSDPNKARVWVVLTYSGAYIGYPSADAIKPAYQDNTMIQYSIESIQTQQQVADLGYLLAPSQAEKIFPDQRQLFE